MKSAGLLLLCAGFAIVAGALALLSSTAARSAFAGAGIAVQLFGLGLSFRAHYTLDEKPR